MSGVSAVARRERLRNFKTEFGPRAGFRVGPDAAAVRLDNPPAGVQAYAGAFAGHQFPGLQPRELLEELRTFALGKTGAGVSFSPSLKGSFVTASTGSAIQNPLIRPT